MRGIVARMPTYRTLKPVGEYLVIECDVMMNLATFIHRETRTVVGADILRISS